MNSLLIHPIKKPFSGSIRTPGSKSLTNRGLILGALAKGQTTLYSALDCEDSRVMIDSLRKLGFEIEWKNQNLSIIGKDGEIPAKEARLFIENSGTSMRFLTALLCLGQGLYEIDGSEQMRKRPIKDLVEALNTLGADIEYVNDEGFPPLRIKSNGLMGGKVSINGSISSQYLSSILMVAPFAQEKIDVSIPENLVSKPYVTMTSELMNAFSKNNSSTIEIEPDASSASYFLAAAAITGSEIKLQGLNENSLQPDVNFARALEKMGCTVRYDENGIYLQGGPLSGIDIDLGDMSDTAQTLAVVALFAEGPTRIRGIAHNRFKETDRIGNLATELRRLGAEVIEHEDGLEITPQKLRGTLIKTYNDHRMAMSFSVAGLVVEDIKIENPSCVEKTYPNFFHDFQKVTGSKAELQ